MGCRTSAGARGYLTVMNPTTAGLKDKEVALVVVGGGCFGGLRLSSSSIEVWSLMGDVCAVVCGCWWLNGMFFAKKGAQIKHD